MGRRLEERCGIASRSAANPKLPAAVLSPRAPGGHYRLLTARQRG
jgi:hypothetical protein